MTGRLAGPRAWLVWAVVAADLTAMAVVTIVLPEMEDFPRIALAVFAGMVASLGIVGALIATRRPRNPIGWILWAAAAGVAIATTGDAVAASLGSAAGSLPLSLLVWLSTLMLIPSLAAVAILVPLFFPDGRLLSPRWRWLVAFTIITIALGLVPAAFRPGYLPDTTVVNPLGVDGLGDLGFLDVLGNAIAPLVAFPLAIASCVLRYRRGTSVERQQVKWFAAAVSLTILSFLVAFIPMPTIADIGWMSAILSITLIPVAIGVAILRYRLYEIDRLISRGLAWAVLSALLVGVYAVGIIVLQGLLGNVTQGGTLSVAASTLLAAALFQPLRRRTQRGMDRRFDRARYDGERVAAAFSERLRGQVDLAGLERDLGATVGAALSPASTALWIRAGGRKAA